MSNLILTISLLISVTISIFVYIYSYADEQPLKSDVNLDSIEYEKYLRKNEDKDRKSLKKIKNEMNSKPKFTGFYCANNPEKMLMKTRNNIFNVWTLKQKKTIDEGKHIASYSGVYNVKSSKDAELFNFRSSYKDYNKKSNLEITKVRDGFVEEFSVIEENIPEGIKFSSKNCEGIKVLGEYEIKTKFKPSYCSDGKNQVKIDFVGRDYTAKSLSNEITTDSGSFQAGTILKITDNNAFVKSSFGFVESDGPFAKLIIAMNEKESLVESFYNPLIPDEVFKAENCK